jgi:anti-sigma factor ChrR (cupin superfamily)
VRREKDCEEVRLQLAERLAGSLDAESQMAVEGHLASCPECQAECADIEGLWRALGDASAVPVPSDRMRERFFAALAAERGHDGDRDSSLRIARRPRTRLAWLGEPLVQMAAAAGLLLVGAIAGRELQPARPAPAPNGEIAEVRRELHDMRQLLTLSLLQQPSATERLRGVSSTSDIDHPGGEIVAALLDTLLHDPNVNVRLAAVDALGRFSDRPEVRSGTKRAVADVSAPLLQIALIDFMVETHDPQAAVAFRQLAQDPAANAEVRSRAQWGLARLSS